MVQILIQYLLRNADKLKAANLPSSVLIDCSHGNLKRSKLTNRPYLTM